MTTKDDSLAGRPNPPRIKSDSLDSQPPPPRIKGDGFDPDTDPVKGRDPTPATPDRRRR